MNVLYTECAIVSMLNSVIADASSVAKRFEGKGRIPLVTAK